MLEDLNTRRIDDAERFKNLDSDRCMVCGAYGNDKRNLRIACFYDIKEVVPLFIELFLTPNIPEGRQDEYYMRICKSCRSAFLNHLEKWYAERAALIFEEKDHDGDVYYL